MITKEQMERINSYYDLKLEGKRIIAKDKINNETKSINIRIPKLYLGFGNITRESASKMTELINEGKVYSFTMTDFLKDYFKLTDEQIFEMQTGQDKRTQKALKEEMERIGLVKYCISEAIFPIEKVTDLSIYYWDTVNEVYGWTDEKEFMVQLVVRCEIDDYYIEHYKFKAIPNQEILDTARLIQRFTHLLELSFIKTEYHKLTNNLDEYDRLIREDKFTHWLDGVGATIEEKMQRALAEQGR